MDKKVFLDFLEEFFKKMNISFSSISLDIEEWYIFNVKIESDDSWLLIWWRGNHINDLKYIIKIFFTNLSGLKRVIVHLEVNDYITKKQDKLFLFISKKIQELHMGKTQIILPYFNPYERKKIHAYIAHLKNDSIYTKSIWEWEERRLHIYKKTPKLTIDMDGVGI